VTYTVKASDLFWRTVDKFEDDPDLLSDIYQTLFDVVEEGVPIWAISTKWGLQNLDGWALSLPGDWASIICAEREENPNEIYVPYMLIHQWTM